MITSRSRQVRQFIFLAGWLLLRCSPAGANQVAFPILPVNNAYFNLGYGSVPLINANARTLILTTPVLEMDSDPIYYSCNITNGSGSTVLDWPASKITTESRPSPSPYASPIQGGIDSYVTFGVNFETGQTSGQTLDAIVTNNAESGINYTISDITIPFLIQGGPFAGQTVHLKAKMASGYTLSDGPYLTFPNGEFRNVSGSILVAIDLGTDPSGVLNYVYLEFQLRSGVYSQDTTVLTVGQVLADLSGTDPVAFMQSFSGAVSSGLMSMQGAIPELLYLYDFTGTNTTPVDQSLLSYFPYLMNQYDAGVIFGLPTRFTLPAPNATGYTPGGNACGPTSLSLALYSFGNLELNPIVYANTMTNAPNGLILSPPNYTNAFNWPRAQAWIEGQINFERLPFPNPAVLTPGMTAYWLFDSNPSRISGDWQNLIDPVLTDLKTPIVFRTDLSIGTKPGAGHVILLLGKGHSSYVADLYGLSGDYYIVADPAGHYFGNSSGVHYGLVTNLMQQAMGLNYGGWYGIYPAELLQQRITLKANNQPLLCALIINDPIPSLRVQAQSPVSVLVTDPEGRQTGINTNGVITENIPQSRYQPAVEDEEEDGATTFPVNGPKTVVINNPEIGNYKVNVVGTAAGNYTLLWEETAANGGVITGTNFTDSITLGQAKSFSINGVVGLPAIQIARQNNLLVLSWPTNATGFSLQVSTNLALSGSWQTISNGIKLLGQQNIFSNQPALRQQFFRLKK